MTIELKTNCSKCRESQYIGCYELSNQEWYCSECGTDNYIMLGDVVYEMLQLLDNNNDYQAINVESYKR